MGLQRVFPKLVLVVLVGLGMRLWMLTSLPPALNWDEVSHAYNSYSVLKTGRDQWGQMLPLVNFRAYGDYPTALNLYLTAPFIAFLGPTDLAVRLPHVVMGTLTVLAGFLAGYWWRRNAYVGMFTALFLAVEPWTLFLSRTVIQSNVAVLALTVALALYFRRRVWSALFFGLSLFAYHNTRIFVPLLVLPGALFAKSRRILWVGLVIVGLVILLLPSSRARGKWVGLVDSGAVAYLEEARNSSQLPPLLTRLVYNRPVYAVTHTLSNYFDYFSPQFLFLKGGTQYQFSVPNFGVEFAANLPFFYLGLIGIIWTPLLAWWLLLGPVPAALTQDQFAVVRATTMIPVVQMASAYGLWWFWSKAGKWRGWVKWGYTAVFIICLVSYWRSYVTDYRIKYSASWQYGYQQMVELVKTNYSKYDTILITKKYGEPHEYIAWYWPWNPQEYQTLGFVSWDYHDSWYWVNSFGRLRFVNDWEMPQVVADLPRGPRYLIIASPENDPKINPVNQINFLDGSPAFIVHEI